MEPSKYVALDQRGLLAVSGPEARPFLQGLLSNDIDRVGPNRALYATLLSPQGKFLHDFFISELDGALVFDCEGPRLDDLERRLNFYKLRADVKIEVWSGRFLVAALIGKGVLAALDLEAVEGNAKSFAGGVVYADPRLAAIGARAILPRDGGIAALEAAGFTAAPVDDYDRLRLAHALPDGSRDMPVEKGFLLENGIDDLNGVDFDKGCYVGQELTARTKYRGNIRKRLYRVDVDGPLPAPGTPITLDAKEAGVMRSGRDQTGLALLRIELATNALDTGAPLRAGDARLTPIKPGWARF
jgi:hypothetical protein